MRKASARPGAVLAAAMALVIVATYLRLDASAPQFAQPVAARVARPAAVHPVPPALRVTIERYCLGCHDTDQSTGGLALDAVDFNDITADLAIWEKVATKLRTREMPPPGEGRPDHATYTQVAAELELALDAAAAAKPNPGRVAVHRLNRAEYTAAIRDLLGLDVDAEALLSSDDSDQEGFDNVASVLSVSPALLENYLAAARRVSRLAVGDVTITPVVETFKISKALVQEEQMSDDL